MFFTMMSEAGQKSENSYNSSMANCVLPEDVMLCIFTRLPVKTILQFKSVCKPWRDLFSTPEFRKLHHIQFPSDQKNQSFIVHSYLKNQFSIFNIDSSKKKPTILDHPFAHTQNIKLAIVGCCNRLVCIYRGLDIVQWNPAMKLFKIVPIKDSGPYFQMLSFGFGYDAAGADFKVVKIVCGIGKLNTKRFSGFTCRNDLIVNGNPHWVARVDGNMGYVCFDVMKLVFKFVPEMERNVDLVDWNGALGFISYINKNQIVENPDCRVQRFTRCSRVASLCVCVFDDGERVWIKKHSFEPIEEENVFRFYHFAKNEKLLGCFRTGKLFVLDLETGSANKLFYDTCDLGSFEVYEYTESLAFTKGMEKY
ncbi:hypothetical protein CASFOL_027782 [Castilleja foliolosa]|uniref:F-box domain-containing protein n=1 Tax=Castilleja foliolosa TaxID=1961234 RepID=A0ABD3CID4_9LAMI